MLASGERLDVQRLRVLPVDPVTDARQPREITQVLGVGGSDRHLRGYNAVVEPLNVRCRQDRRNAGDPTYDLVP